MTNLQKKIAIKATSDCSSFTKAKQLANQLKIPIISSNADFENYNFVLTFNDNRLELISTESKSANPICIDFLSNKLAYRQKFGGGQKQLIAKAVGLKKNNAADLNIIDATAGLGTDAFILASLGCNVHMIERSPIIAALLQDALDRAATHPDFANIKLKLTIADAIEYLQKIPESKRPDIIYLDPMYPERKKTALGKKEMRILKEIVGEDLDAEKLLEISLKCARKRIAVKRPKLAPTINSTTPNLVYNGKSSRYDVYYTGT